MRSREGERVRGGGAISFSLVRGAEEGLGSRVCFFLGNAESKGERVESFGEYVRGCLRIDNFNGIAGGFLYRGALLVLMLSPIWSGLAGFGESGD